MSSSYILSDDIVPFLATASVFGKIRCDTIIKPVVNEVLGRRASLPLVGPAISTPVASLLTGFGHSEHGLVA